ncbi:N-acetylmuramic acid 6-phosphate etherase [Homoserinibacter sp. YIM 151385]|uniref:N-acetylmuramic acid 6-phosphate etherase n=1 Tax=Homoserinibacter sp. YIM 151385 TaxID=2985506 RepID=UPI0022F0F45E|nr:N-acetylmuramic acid 6-phosphate etherase [Homoserinibacter sp. YIM 151385]WBU36768.1 N-acetylmuramic acid 6-phosphate etherase [Homoserinibacter sp. YIM 151385]
MPSGAERELPPTERRLDASRGLDELDAAGILALIGAEDRVALAAVEAVRDELAALVEEAALRVRAGGGVHYVGAGTSGRLAALDAAELRPTYSLEEGIVTAHLAGGEHAILRAVEGAEDDAEAGAALIGTARIGAGDVVVGIAASGRTPYVGGALRAARAAGALAVLVSNDPAAPLAAEADRHVLLDTGPEVVTGSTRMKAGTAQKVLLGAFSTALMVRLGRVHSNLMVAVDASNDKLRARSLRILREATGLGAAAAASALEDASGELRVAIVATLAEVPAGTARGALAGARGSVREAMRTLADAEGDATT